MISYYKKIVDFFVRMGANGIGYWDLTAVDRKAKGLPRLFSEEVYFDINEWFGWRPSITPPHIRNLQLNKDNNLQVPTNQSDCMQDHTDSDADTEDPMDIAEDSTSHETDFNSRRAWCCELDEFAPPAAGLLSWHNTPTVSPLLHPSVTHQIPLGAQKRLKIEILKFGLVKVEF